MLKVSYCLTQLVTDEDILVETRLDLYIRHGHTMARGWQQKEVWRQIENNFLL